MTANDLLFAFVGGYSRFIINQKQFNHFNLMNKKQAIAAAVALFAAGNVDAFETAFAEIAKSDIENMNITQDYRVTVYDLNEEGEV